MLNFCNISHIKPNDGILVDINLKSNEISTNIIFIPRSEILICIRKIFRKD